MSTATTFSESGNSPPESQQVALWKRCYTLHHLDITLSARWDAKVHPLPRPLPETGRIITSVQFRYKTVGVVSHRGILGFEVRAVYLQDEVSAGSLWTKRQRCI